MRCSLQPQWAEMSERGSKPGQAVKVKSAMWAQEMNAKPEALLHDIHRIGLMWPTRPFDPNHEAVSAKSRATTSYVHGALQAWAIKLLKNHGHFFLFKAYNISMVI